jgi:ribosomal protein S18 acetylase RimI-like enzyme
VDPAELLAAYDAQVRRGTVADGSGARVEMDGPVVRWVAVNDWGWCGITWSQLADAAAAEAAIARQVGYFGGLGLRFEWKLYDYDRPPDLGDRLAAAGFVPDASEALMIAEVADQPAEVRLPDGVTLQPVTSEADVAALIEVHQRVFGGDHTRLRRSLLSQLRQAPGTTAMVLAMAGREPVCSARIDFLPGSEFAGLWGGGTLPAWRGRGIYRALVAYRARLAAERGYRYLSVDASADSAPILRRLGFCSLAQTTPYLWTGD